MPGPFLFFDLEAIMELEKWKKICTAWKNYCAASLALETALGRTALGTGEFAEALVCSFMEATQSEPSQSGFDLVLADGTRVQVKSRKIERPRRRLRTTELGEFSSLTDFDLLVVVLFDKNGKVVKAGKIPRDKLSGVIKTKTLNKDGQKIEKNVLYVNEKFFEREDVVDMTNELNDYIR
jgi:hypothetical protein